MCFFLLERFVSKINNLFSQHLKLDEAKHIETMANDSLNFRLKLY